MPTRGDRLAEEKKNEIILIGVVDYHHFPALLAAPHADNHPLSGFSGVPGLLNVLLSTR